MVVVIELVVLVLLLVVVVVIMICETFHCVSIYLLFVIKLLASKWSSCTL